MEKKDIPFAVGLTTSEGWSSIPLDFEALVSYHPTAAFVAERRSERLGMVSAVSYGSFGFIGNLIVEKEQRKRGIGTDLMNHGIDHLERLGNASIFLDAVQEAQPLYQQLGFRRLCESMRFSGCIQCKQDRSTRVIQNQDTTSIFNMDRRAFGADRSFFLMNTLQHHRSTCKVAVDDKGVRGYCLAVQTPDWLKIGPLIVEEDADVVGNLLRALLEDWKTARVKVGVLEENTEAVKLYRSIGLQEASPSIRMIRGEQVPERKHGNEFAIGSPAKG